MLRLREQQQEVFSRKVVDEFVARLALQLATFFPAYCEALGESAVEAEIREGVGRAAKYGIVSERGVCLYVNAMFAFGRDFDADPALPWASAILRDPGASDAVIRVERLVDAAFEHLDDARGLWAREAGR